jgi:hypothetical protein
MSARGSVYLVLLAAASATLALVLLSTGCSHQAPAPEAKRGDALQAGLAVSIDLDGDGTAEVVLIDGKTRRLTITDGSLLYQSREKWRVVAACLGDTDGNGLPEVLTLLDSSAGRHLGLFGYSPSEGGGEYRERLVTAVLRPKPLALKVMVAGSTGSTGEAAAGDLLVLTEEKDPGATGTAAGSKSTTYRWNGFGFTALDSAQ